MSENHGLINNSNHSCLNMQMYILMYDTPQRQFKHQPVPPFSLILQTFVDKPEMSFIHELADTLHRPPVAIFIAQARQRHGWRHGIVKCVTFSFPQARHAFGTTRGSDVESSSSSEDDDSESCFSGIGGCGCFLFKFDISGISMESNRTMEELRVEWGRRNHPSELGCYIR